VTFPDEVDFVGVNLSEAVGLTSAKRMGVVAKNLQPRLPADASESYQLLRFYSDAQVTARERRALWAMDALTDLQASIPSTVRDGLDARLDSDWPRGVLRAAWTRLHEEKDHSGIPAAARDMSVLDLDRHIEACERLMKIHDEELKAKYHPASVDEMSTLKGNVENELNLLKAEKRDRQTRAEPQPSRPSAVVNAIYVLPPDGEDRVVITSVEGNEHQQRREEEQRAAAICKAGRPDVDLYRFSVEMVYNWSTILPPCWSRHCKQCVAHCLESPHVCCACII
jgi:hypothetical protein